ncbi:MAG: hydrogenase expression/formation protein HypE [Desulfurococcaceae archaeon]|nr:hydrogenase expression/formation protein HypE [Sulfolobales archaeon]MDW8170734.1 hydrogenase expression/formation protein HypE [Desulfurococcaceae archaeon]
MHIELHHGAGSREMWELLNKLIVSKVPRDLMKTPGGYGIDALDDGAVVKVGEHYVVLTVDTYTVNPIFFEGGDIGKLAVSGTLNDVVMMGARPIAFMDTIVVEEGFEIPLLEEIVESMTTLLKEEGVPLIGGDFKVMPRGSIDKITITGVGIGLTKKPVIDVNIEPGDVIIVTAPIAEHGAVILAHQLGLSKEIMGLKSDLRPLTRTILPVIERYVNGVHAARDPTRGGLAAILSEWAESTRLTILIDRSRVPMRSEVRDFLEAMGIDPLNVASEGVAVLAVERSIAEEVLNDLRRFGEVHASMIGEVVKPSNPIVRGKVVALTEVGGRTIVEAKSINLPRIC